MGNAMSEDFTQRVKNAKDDILDAVWNTQADISTDTVEPLLKRHGATCREARASLYDSFSLVHFEERKKMEFYAKKDCEELRDFQKRVLHRLKSAAWAVRGHNTDKVDCMLDHTQR